MDQQQFKARTKRFSLDVIALVEGLPRNRISDVLGKQLLRSATSVAANYRAACRGKSTADFIAKMGIVEEEADECMLWFELLVESGASDAPQLKFLHREANEILSMTVSSIKTARAGLQNPKSQIRSPQSK